MSLTKFIIFVIYALVSYLIVIVLSYDIGYGAAQTDCDKLLLQKDSIIMLKDSLFREHLKHCSFISNSMLDTNKYGDVFVLDSRDLTFKELY